MSGSRDEGNNTSNLRVEVVVGVPLTLFSAKQFSEENQPLNDVRTIKDSGCRFAVRKNIIAVNGRNENANIFLPAAKLDESYNYTFFGLGWEQHVVAHRLD